MSTTIPNSTVAQIISQVRPYSMVPDDGLALTIYSTIYAIEEGLTGDLVECGAWRGGCSFAMLLAQRAKYGSIIRPIWMFDSFQGLPPVDVRDGPAAAKYQATPDSPDFFDNCKASLKEVRDSVAFFGFSPTECIVVPGWFEATFPENLPKLLERRIAMLRIDCDWYSPVKLTLDQMGPLVVENGIIILDDYFTWDGCARATHDYLSQNNLPYRIESRPSRIGAWMVKQTNGRAHRP
jgi:O-methyltransferase